MKKHEHGKPKRGPLKADMTAHWTPDSRLREMDYILKRNISRAFRENGGYFNGGNQQNRQSKRPTNMQSRWTYHIFTNDM